jgi:hypothetical protein
MDSPRSGNPYARIRTGSPVLSRTTRECTLTSVAPERQAGAEIGFLVAMPVFIAMILIGTQGK